MVQRYSAVHVDAVGYASYSLLSGVWRASRKGGWLRGAWQAGTTCNTIRLACRVSLLRWERVAPLLSGERALATCHLYYSIRFLVSLIRSGAR
eukprot:3202916-Pyramimonas_sp.AAC.1